MTRLIEIKMQLTLEELMKLSEESDILTDEYEYEMEETANVLSKNIAEQIHNNTLSEIYDFLQVIDQITYNRHEYFLTFFEKIVDEIRIMYDEKIRQGIIS